MRTGYEIREGSAMLTARQYATWPSLQIASTMLRTRIVRTFRRAK